jgi:anti-sigma factor RsiW
MQCSEAQGLVHAYIDKELDVVRALEIDAHLRNCPVCTTVYQRQHTLRAAIKRSAPTFPDSEMLFGRIKSALQAGNKSRSRRRLWWSWGYGAVLVAAVVVTWAVTYALTSTDTEEQVTDSAVSAHMRSYMGDHLTDIAAADPAVVAAWFKGRLAFSPLVKDLSDKGFVLVGGRMDYLYKRAVAALVYRHGDQVINVFTWPVNRRDDFPARLLMDEGFRIMFWNSAGMNFCSISDISPAELAQFVSAFKS